MKKTKMLKKNYEFRKVLSRGKFFREKNIGIFILKNNEKINLLGIAVSTKNGKAFQRNRAKRLVRESFRRFELKLKEGHSIVILINKQTDLNNINFHSIYEEIQKCFEKANIFKEEE